MATYGKVVGPGGSSKSAKSVDCKSVGPGGVAGSNVSYTTKRGYEENRTAGMRTTYKETGRPGKTSK